MYKPYTLDYRDTYVPSGKASVWYRNFILFDEFPTAVENYYGMLFTRTFCSYSHSSGDYNIASFYGGLVNPVTYKSKGFSGTPKGYQSSTSVTWKLRVWYAQIDELKSGNDMLKDMIVKVKESENSSSPIIMVNRRLSDDDKIQTYYTYPYEANYNINNNFRIKNITSFGKVYVNNWRNSHSSDASENRVKEFDTGKK